MTAVLVAIAVVAGLRGCWSPCGLSMLSTITPISERGRGNRYASTARWFVAGALVGGACLGVALAAVALAGPIDGRVGGAAVAIAALVTAASDAGVTGRVLPSHRRQVNERWLDRYRPWVYGGGFGWQIGTGVATYVTTAAMYLLVVVAAVAGSPRAALAAGLVFGLTRGSAVWLPRNVQTPDDLRALHVRVQHAGPRLHVAVVVVQLAIGVLAAATLGPVAAVVVGVVAAAVLVRMRRVDVVVCDLDENRRYAT